MACRSGCDGEIHRLGSPRGRPGRRKHIWEQHIFHDFGRTKLRMGVSGANFHAKSHFEVRVAVAPQKPRKTSEKLTFRIENVVNIFLFRV